MQWEVTGADRETGADVSIVIEADNEASRTRRGNRRGVMVASVKRICQKIPPMMCFLFWLQYPMNRDHPPRMNRDAGGAKLIGSMIVLLVAIVLAAFVIMLRQVRRSPSGTPAIVYSGPSASRLDASKLNPFSSLNADLILASASAGLQDNKDNAEDYKKYHRRSSSEALGAMAVAETSATEPDRQFLSAYGSAIHSLISDLNYPGYDSVGLLYSSRPVDFFTNNGKTCMDFGTIASDEVYNINKLEAKERAAKAVNSMVLPVMSPLSRAMKDSEVEVYEIAITYGAQDFAGQGIIYGEGVYMLIPKDVCENFADSKITDQQLLDQSDIFLDEKDAPVKKVSLTIK